MNFISTNNDSTNDLIDLERVRKIRKSDWKGQFYIIFEFGDSSKDFARWTYHKEMIRNIDFEILKNKLTKNISLGQL